MVIIGGGEILVNIAWPICSNSQMESTQALANKSVPFHQHAHLLKPLLLLADLVQDIKIKATVAVLTGTSTNMRASVGWHHQKVIGGLWQEISLGSLLSQVKHQLFFAANASVWKIPMRNQNSLVAEIFNFQRAGDPHENLFQILMGPNCSYWRFQKFYASDDE